MVVKLKKWGNSQGIRISKEVLVRLNISEKDIENGVDFDIKIVNGDLVLTLINDENKIALIDKEIFELQNQKELLLAKERLKNKPIGGR